MVDQMSAGDARPTRLRALYDRIERLPEPFLEAVEGKVTECEHRIPPVPGTTRTVAGATITERPDLVLQGSVDHPAEVAREGMVRR